MAKLSGKDSDGPLLNPLYTTELELRSANRTRHLDHIKKSIHPADEEEYSAGGWMVEKSGKKSLKITKPKSIAARLEDRVWCLLYRLGYPVLNGDDFKIAYQRQDGTIGRKQVDVFAKDDETVIVVECKSREVRGRRALQKDIHETENLQKPFANSIRKHFGQDFRPKILWFYVTENIIWSEGDVERAESAGIRILTENELQYFEAYVSHVGSAGRYQFLAEYLAGQEIPGLSGKKVPATRGNFGPDKFYAFTISARHLLKIAFVNHQALNHPDSRPAYQRMISKARLRNIGKFIEKGGVFPTNILINFDSECKFDLLPQENAGDGTRLGMLYLPGRYKSAWIIDGQHRLFGFTDLPDKYLDRPLFVVAFEGLNASKEADLFITINHEQKSVPKGLLVALQADLKLGSEDPREGLVALASALVRSVSVDNTSPLFRRFSVPGVTPIESQNLTIAEAVKGLTQSTLLGRVLNKKSRVSGFLSAATDEKTIERSRKILNSYFRLLMDANPKRWNDGRAAHICVNPAIRAHFRLINEILKYLSAKGVLDPQVAPADDIAAALVSFVKPLAEFVRSAPDDVIASKFSRKFGEGGVSEYYFSLCEVLHEKNKDFGGEEFLNYRTRKADQRNAVADATINDLSSVISKVVIDALKDLYGTDELDSGEKAYWELGIENSDIKQQAYKKQQQTPPNKRSPREAYLDLIDFEKIIRQKGNWERLKPIFSIPLRGVNPKSKEYHLDWLNDLNEIRRVSAHKSPFRQYKEEDYQFIDWLKKEIYDRCSLAGIPLN